MSHLQRLQKILSESGVASRRKAEDLIREARVTVNGRLAQVGDKADPFHDHIKVDGRRISLSSSAKVYLLLNKPKGTVTTVADPEGRPTVLDLIKETKPRLFPVGRLDFDAEGFLLLTDDGAMAHRLSHPSYGISRIYRVKVKGKPSPEEISRLSRGIRLEDGPTAPCRIRPFQETEDNLWLEMVLHEGRNRQVKRMWEKLGYPVLKLKRVAFAGLSIGRLKPGEYRYLRPSEVQRLKDLLAKHLSPGASEVTPPKKKSKSREGVP
ncbi:MAG: pseudouridine synthase [Thermodesulfobacteriota bacterium]|nr:pseudouridine synthase [Thermodesulfobacteriota bacterium]